MSNRSLYVSVATDKRIDMLNDIIGCTANLSQSVALGIEMLIERLESMPEAEKAGYILLLKARS